jgi:hypothetical protein
MNKSRSDIPEIEFASLPTLEEHEARIRRVWRILISVAVGTVVLAVTAVALLLWSSVPLTTIATAIPVIMICGVYLFGVGFAIPAGLTSMDRLRLTIHMGFESLKMARTTTLAVRDLKTELAPVLRNLRAIVDDLKPVAQVANRQAQDGYLEKIESHLRTIADRVKRDTAPVPVRTRPTTEG